MTVSRTADFTPLPTLSALAAALQAGTSTSRELVETALERIAAPQGQGRSVFIEVHAQAARQRADALDKLRAAGTVLSPLMGVPVSIKDLFDVAGQVTRAGSVVLSDAPPARTDASTVARLQQAGAVIIGRTNMTEFAFSGLGLNPHYGTPASPWQRTAGDAERRIAGGSSSGAAACVADGMAAVALGTDTGGSVRIPAALCGLTGFKPTARRIPTDGVLPLSSSLDSVGPIGSSVACCAVTDRILAGLPPIVPPSRPIEGVRLGALTHLMLDDMDLSVARAYDDALQHLSAAGARVSELRFAPLERLAHVNRLSLPSIESFAWHRKLIENRASDYDPRVLARIRKGERASAADYIELLRERADIIAQAEPLWHSFDAIVCPTVPIVPPRIAELQADDAVYARVNATILRNPSMINYLDGCALSLPCSRHGEAPVGLMLASGTGRDTALLMLGRAVEAVLAPLR